MGYPTAPWAPPGWTPGFQTTNSPGLPVPGGVSLPGGEGQTPSGNVSGSSLPGGLTWGDILKFGGNLASGIASYAGSEAQRKQQAQEFAQSLGLNAQSLLNRAPVADKAQYLAMNSAPPTAFQPRDYTQGLNQLQGQPTGGAAAQLAANAAASANYKPGAGGVNTSTLQAILAKLGYPQNAGG